MLADEVDELQQKLDAATAEQPHRRRLRDRRGRCRAQPAVAEPAWESSPRRGSERQLLLASQAHVRLPVTSIPWTRSTAPPSSDRQAPSRSSVASGRRGSRASLPPPLDELQREIDGTVVARTSPGYTRAHRLYNTRFDAYRPLAVAYCESVGDVEKTIAWSHRHGIRIAPRGGGHSYGGYSSIPGGVIVDVSRLAAVTVHPGRQATVGAGAKLIDVYAGLAAHGDDDSGRVVRDRRDRRASARRRRRLPLAQAGDDERQPARADARHRRRAVHGPALRRRTPTSTGRAGAAEAATSGSPRSTASGRPRSRPSRPSRPRGAGRRRRP